MLAVQCIQIIKYTFDVPVVAMVSHIPAKSRMAVNYVSPDHFQTPKNCRFPKKEKKWKGEGGEWNKLLSSIVNRNGK